MDLHVYSSWRFFVFWSSGSTAYSPVCFMLQAPYDPKRCPYIMKWSLYLLSVDCWRCAVLRIYIEGGDFSESWFGFVPRFWPKLAKMKVPLPPAVIGQRILSGNGTASLFCNLQINIYGSACSAGLCGSRPSGKIEERAFRGLQLSLCLLSWAWRGEQHKCALFCHRVNKIELNCALCFWKLPWVNTCTSPIVQCCQMHTLHLEPQNNLKDFAKKKSCC